MSGSGTTLKTVRERKLAELLPEPASGGVLEASGVIAKGRNYYVVFDNIRRIARVGRRLTAESNNVWLGRPRAGEGYEDIAYSPRQRRFYLLIEAEKHPDGTYKSVIEECDESGRYRGRSWVDFSFESRNTGFEGLCVVRAAQTDYLLALCEGNHCAPGPKGRKPGNGRIHVLHKKGRLWKSLAVIKLPSGLEFKDYASVDLRRGRIAVVSQKSSKVWIGKLRVADWTIADRGRTLDFPRSSKGKRLYCTVEGIAWVSDTSLVAVSDLRKKGYPDRCAQTDQSIHVFHIPT